MMGMRENFALINYDKISFLTIEKGVFSSTLKIRAEGFAGDISAINKDKADRILSYIKERMDQTTTSAVQSSTNDTTTTTTSNPQSSSAADELTKIARLKEQGILSEAEFNQMKQEILKKL
jgi:hypothetical protein